MEKGKLNITKSKKGKIIVNAMIGGKTIPIQNTGFSDTSLDGKDAEFERVKGQVQKISCDGKVVFSKEKSVQKPPFVQKNTPYNQYKKGKPGGAYKPPVNLHAGALLLDHVMEISDKAKAPYNFIPLNEKVAEAEPVPEFDRYQPGRHTGWIDLEIETKTPLYIRDTRTADEIRENEISHDFFSPGGKFKIPGSSIRGMLRTLVEITSYGRFGEFDDRKLFYRAVADTSSLGAEYKKIMVDESDFNFPKIEAGILKKEGQKFLIYPSIIKENTQIYRVNYDKCTKIVDGPGKLILKSFEFTEIYFNPIKPDKHDHKRPNGGTHKLKYALLTSVSIKRDKDHPCKGYLVSSGPFGKKKHMHWVINEPAGTFIELPDSILREYQLDVSKSEQSDLIEEMIKKRKNENVPCFFIRDENGNITSFGHTGMFRLAYKKSIGDHIPENLRTMNYEISPDRLERIRKAGVPEEIVIQLEKLEKSIFSEKDFTEKLRGILSSEKGKEHREIILKHAGKWDIPVAMFGNADTFAGRLFFEDATLGEGQTNFLMEMDIPKLLQTPKPTTFQHYLVQKSDHIKDRCHYNDNTAIRGNKLYWHKSGEDWVENDPEKRKNEKLITKIRPVKPGTKFSGRIRFENLTSVELGALLFSLDLPEGCFHKLGMGKPIGLGSVYIRPVLHLSDRRKRYEDLFFEWEKDPEKVENTADFKQKFEDDVIKQIGDKSTSLWETPRLSELKAMLDFNKGRILESNGRTRYMEIERKIEKGKSENEFKKRPILPLPSRA